MMTKNQINQCELLEMLITWSETIELVFAAMKSEEAGHQDMKSANFEIIEALREKG